jgi:circadian clock protein KaiC
MSIQHEHGTQSEFPKAATGIDGFKDITRGGPPRGRPTLVVGGIGSRKTPLAMQSLVNSATKYNEPGVFFSFEESEIGLVQNVRSCGFNLKDIDPIGDKRVATVGPIFAAFGNTAVLRSGLRRLFRFLKGKGVTAVITGETGSEGALTTNGLDKYACDDMTAFDNRATGNTATRRMKVLEYRGSFHGSNEHPYPMYMKTLRTGGGSER